MTRHPVVNVAQRRAAFGTRTRVGATTAVGALLASAFVTGSAPAVAQAPFASAGKVAHTAATKVRTLQDPRITESSSLARSLYRKKRGWTANDSGDGTTLYAIGKSGKTVRSFEL